MNLHAVVLAALAAGTAAPWADLAGSEIWDRGVAELALYHVSGPKEGLPRTYEAVMVVVKEPFDLDRMVKAGPGATRVVEVLKLNHEVTVPTGIYDYRQMASVFLRRADLAPLKLTVASQELCGITSKHWRSDEPGVFRTASYFDGEGDRDFALEFAPGTLFYDALPLWLRAQPPRPEALEVRLVPDQIGNQAANPAAAKALIRWGEVESVLTPVARFSAREVTVDHARGRDRFLFQEDFPHVLVCWERADGAIYALANLVRLPYWRYTRPGDRKLLEKPDPVRSQVNP